MANSAVYSGITVDLYNKLRSQLSSVGIDMEGNQGKIEEKGISAGYNYSSEANTLAITDVKVGFPASMMYNSDKILDKITETVEQNGGKRQT